jgi:hypothetical protein
VNGGTRFFFASNLAMPTVTIYFDNDRMQSTGGSKTSKTIHLPKYNGKFSALFQTAGRPNLRLEFKDNVLLQYLFPTTKPLSRNPFPAAAPALESPGNSSSGVQPTRDPGPPPATAAAANAGAVASVDSPLTNNCLAFRCGIAATTCGVECSGPAHAAGGLPAPHAARAVAATGPTDPNEPD